MACFGELGRQTGASCAGYLPVAVRRAIRGLAAGAMLPVARNELAPVPAGGETLIFRCHCNSPERRNDVGGAFAPSAALFAYYNSVPWSSIVVIENGAANDRALDQIGADVLAAIDAWNGPPLRCVAFFCHGSPNWLQLGFRNAGVPQLARAIAAKAGDDVTVPLFACLTGAAPEEYRFQKWRRDCETARGEGREPPPRPPDSEPPAIAGQLSFAFTLRDALVQGGKPRARVDAHASVGHASRNPDVRRFESPSGSAGFRLTTGPDEATSRARRRALASAFARPAAAGSLLLYRFPFLDLAAITPELDRIAPAAAPPR